MAMKEPQQRPAVWPLSMPSSVSGLSQLRAGSIRTRTNLEIRLEEEEENDDSSPAPRLPELQQPRHRRPRTTPYNGGR